MGYEPIPYCSKCGEPFDKTATDPADYLSMLLDALRACEAERDSLAAERFCAGKGMASMSDERLLRAKGLAYDDAWANIDSLHDEIDRLKAINAELVEALDLAARYIGHPTHEDLRLMDDDAGVRHTITIRHIKKIRDALAKAKAAKPAS